MADESGISSSGGTPNPIVIVNHDYNTSDKNNYAARPPTFSGDSTEFEWWKIKMYTYIIYIDDESWDVLEYGINIQVNGLEWCLTKNISHLLRKIFTKNIIE